MCMVCLSTNGRKRPCRNMYSTQDLEIMDRLAEEQIYQKQTKKAILDLLKTDPEFRKEIQTQLNEISKKGGS